jgi:hypothetical protein
MSPRWAATIDCCVGYWLAGNPTRNASADEAS